MAGQEPQGTFGIICGRFGRAGRRNFRCLNTPACLLPRVQVDAAAAMIERLLQVGTPCCLPAPLRVPALGLVPARRNDGVSARSCAAAVPAHPLLAAHTRLVVFDAPPIARPLPPHLTPPPPAAAAGRGDERAQEAAAARAGRPQRHPQGRAVLLHLRRGRWVLGRSARAARLEGPAALCDARGAALAIKAVAERLGGGTWARVPLIRTDNSGGPSLPTSSPRARCPQPVLTIILPLSPLCRPPADRLPQAGDRRVPPARPAAGAGGGAVCQGAQRSHRPSLCSTCILLFCSGVVR